MNAVAVLSIFVAQALVCCEGRAVGDHLMKVLLDDYNRDSIPLRNISDSVKLNVGLTLIRVINYDDDANIVTVMGWLVMTWSDFRFQWSPANFKNLKVIRMPAEHIWTPDLMLYNKVDTKPLFSPVNTVVSHRGSVIWVPPMQISFPCKPEGKGTFNCTSTFGSWTFDGLQLDLTVGELDISDLSENPKLAVSNPTSMKNTKYYPCCKEPYPSIDFSFKVTAKED